MDNFRDSYFKIDWDLSKKRLKGTFWGKQYDTGRGFEVTVINGGQVLTATTEVLRLKWEKPDNTSGYVNATVVNGKFIIENIDQMFTVHGSVRADFELSVAGETMASITFYVSVEKAVAVGAIESSSDFTALQTALASADSLETTYAPRLTSAEAQTKIDKKSGIMASQRNAFKHFEKLPLATIGTFEASETWEQVSATVSADTVNYKSGTQGLKLTSVNGVEAKAQRTGLTLNLFSASYIDVWLYVEQLSNISSIDIYLHTTEADYYKFRINPQIDVKYQREGWIRLKIPKYSTYTVATGAPSFANIVKVALAVKSTVGATASATFDNLSAYESGARLGKVMIRFDDGNTSTATTGKAILDKYNQRGVLAILPNKVGTTGYANLSQLKNLENTGWDIINHTWNHDNLSLASAETAREVIKSAAEWMVDNEIGNGNVIVLPGHGTNATVQGVCEELNIITCAGLSGYETLPPSDIHALKSLAGDSMTAATIKSYIDACALDKSFLILLFHGVDNSGNTYSVTPAILEEVCAYIATKEVDVVTFSDLITQKALLSEKANKPSGLTQSPTFLNGWGGNVTFSKNDMGEVWVRGTMTLGTKTFGTAILSLPVGFTPPFFLPVPFFDSSGKTIHGAVLSIYGEIQLYEGATGATYTDATINFKFNT